MKIKVYLNECDSGEFSIILISKEFGWMEYYDNYDEYRPLIFKNKSDFIDSYYGKTYNQKLSNFQKWNKLTYLGDL